MYPAIFTKHLGTRTDANRHELQRILNMTQDIYDQLRTSLADAPRRDGVLHKLLPVWPLIQEARAAGVSWPEIGQRLAGVGIVRADGRAFTPQTLVWAAGRLDLSKPIQRRLKEAQPVTVARVHDPPPRPAAKLPAETGAWVMPPEVAVFLEEKKAPPGTGIDNFLKELKNGK